MRARGPLTAVTLAALVALLAGCGDGSADATTAPDDFAITVHHADGSLPPPHHAVWRLSVDDAGQGVLAYTPDYPGPGVPTFTAEFDVEAGAIEDLYAALRRADLLRDLTAATPPAGSTVETATVTAAGHTYEIPAYADGSAPMAPLERRIRNLVPARVWSDFAERRREYARDRYGEAP
jgi:hypothetical protein